MLQALSDSLEELGNDNREMIISYFEKNYGPRYTVESRPSRNLVNAVSGELLGSAAHIFVRKFELELTKYPCREQDRIITIADPSI